ncbi:MAG: hypothetical protein VXX06_04345, partial [Pseudomonadota bacterium]|nr:hypothetical protein [Pseudomonadota bacterium]
MKDLTTNQKLFSDIVMFLETSIEHPYLKNRDVGSFDELADALNARGHRNSRGQRLTGRGINKFISRMSEVEKK